MGSLEEDGWTFASPVDDEGWCESDFSEFNEDLHREQPAVYRKDNMSKIFESNVLISGLNGLGVEIAKNLVLAGVKSVTLHDEHNVDLWDLSSNFYLSEDDVGKNRALACVQKLKELNRTVLVSTMSGTMYNTSLNDYQVVVFTDIGWEKAIYFDDYCRCSLPPKSFIKCAVRGLFGSVFCDFGPKFEVVDVDGDLVGFSGVEGMEEVEEDTFSGVTQVKQKILKFKALRDAIKVPGNFLLSGFSKFDRAPLLHLAFLALDLYRDRLGQLPVAGSEEDYERLMTFAAEMNERLGDNRLAKIDGKLLRQFSNGSRAVLNPMAAIFGGIVAQEVIKACTAKFQPLFQFFYFDSVESLPDELLEAAELKPLNCRYDPQISVLGSKLQKKLEEAKVFIVGSGALGCEFLKNLALMGVCCNTKGKLTITDDDIIEKSNLCTQFLFRDRDIGLAKSNVAATAAGSINPNLHIEALQNRVNLESENVFDDAFWNGLDVVISAVDNVTARKYIDRRCLYFRKPLLESGTLGAMCSTQMVIPRLTENYGASTDPPEKQEPMAKIPTLPENINHCITWAISEFESLFQKIPSEVNTFLDNQTEYASSMRSAGNAQAKELLERVIEFLGKGKCETFEDCWIWAESKFVEYLSNEEMQSPYAKQLNSLDGRPLDDVKFVMSGSILRAEAFGISIPEHYNRRLSEAGHKKMMDRTRRVKTVAEQKATSMSTASIDDVINDLILKLDAFAEKPTENFRMKPTVFEKDDDYHMDFITELANMRARLHHIEELEKCEAKIKAGRIIPAIATSTAMATGFVCLELYKVISGNHKREDYRNTFANLDLPFFSIAEPLPPKTVKHKNDEWTAWDRWSLHGDLTVSEFIGQLKKDRGVNVNRIFCGTSLLYEERNNKKLTDLAKTVAKSELPSYRNQLDVTVFCEGNNGNDVEIPLVSVYFRTSAIKEKISKFGGRLRTSGT